MNAVLFNESEKTLSSSLSLSPSKVAVHHVELNMDTLDILVNKNYSMLWSSMNVRKDIFWLERLKCPALFYNGHHWLLRVKVIPVPWDRIALSR